jgi:nucleotide-binding universal stress UspA family protein
MAVEAGMAAPSDTRPIVVGVDGSDSAARAAGWAAREADLRGATVRVVHVSAWLDDASLDARIEPGYQEAAREHGRTALDAAGATIERVAPAVRYDSKLVCGAPVKSLILESAEAQLVVLGSRGLGGFAALLVGSVADALASAAHCPIVIVRGAGIQDPGWSAGPVVVGVDRGTGSDAALDFAFRAAAVRGAELVAVHAWESVPIYPLLELRVMWEEIAKEQRRLLDDRIEPWCGKYPDVAVRTVVGADRPARMLLEQADGAQLLVVGSRGLGPYTASLLGSTSRALLHHATCPLAVARSEGSA